MRSIVKLSVLSVLLSGVVAWGDNAKAVTDTFVASGTWTAPPGVTSVVVEAWGGGGAGGGNNTNVDGGGGGGGGGYSMATIAVVPGTLYTVTVGAGGTAVDLADGGAGGDSWFSTTATLLAKGGGGGAAPAGGAGGVGGVGGAAAAGVGTTRFSGGNGGTGRNSTTGRGGPGGSSAGTAANGTSGPATWATATAAAAPAGGGIGGNGGNANRQDGFAPASGNGGGGGGGAEQSTMGGNGAVGKVMLTYILPAVISINLADANPTGAASVSWTVTFNTSVDGVNSGNFALVNSGLGGAPAITSVIGSGTTWTVTASTGTGTGTLGLDMVNDTGASTVLSNLPFTGQVYTIDKMAPSVSSMMRVDPTPTALASVSWTVVFSESVTGVDATDFALAQTGVSGAIITAVTPVSGTTYTVTVSTGTGNGSLGLNLADDDSIIDATVNQLGGAGAGNGDFSGETYSVVKTVSATASPTACINVTGIGTQTWGTLTGPLTSNNAYATASVNDNQTTNYLQCTGYGFAIPATALIEGIVVNIERNATNTLVRDAAMRLVKDVSGVATIQATDRSTATNYTTTDVVEAHGGTADVWGDTWTAADINSANFGAAFASMKNGTFGGARTVRVDHMPITVHYTVPVPVAEYRMDEAIWNGTANEVADSSGNGLHGSALLGAIPATAKICNGANLAANYVQVPGNSLLDITGALTITAWIKPTRWGGAPGDALMTFLSKDTNFEGHVNATGNIVWWWGSGSITSAATAPIGVWTHVAMVYANGSQTLYINGAVSGTSAVAGALPTNALPFQIGNDQEFGGGTRRFDGMIDEVKIFNRALPPAQISAAYANENAGNNWDGTPRVCPTYAPHHLEIQHASGMGLTCAASTLTIRACADAACSFLNTAGVSGMLSATGAGMTVNWDGTTGGAAGAGFAIPSGSGTVTKNVQVATAGSVVFGVSSSLPAPANGTSCNFGSPACTFTASLAGFIFSDSATGNATYTIPSLISGVGQDTTNLLWLRAVQASAANAAVCAPAIINQTVTVDMGYACNDPNACQTGDLGNINGTAIASAGTAVSLAFDANGSAAITSVRYDDVGQIMLNASKTVTPFAGATAVTLNGSSNAFVVAPHHFGFSGVSAAPIKAGNNFAATVTAYNGLATPAVTANFGQESVPEGVTLSFSKCQPTGTNSSNGTFSGNAGAFTSGVATATDLTWSEVGNGDLVATNSTYLGSTLSATGNTGTGGTVCNGAGNVGPFIPDHFDTVVTGPMSCPAGLACPPGGLVYSGQAFTANVYARNAAGATTQNYDGTVDTSPNFAKAVTLRAWDALGSEVTENPPSGTGSLTGSSVASTAFNRGTTLLGTPGAPVYTFGTNPTAPTDVYIRATDTDNVTSLRVPANTSVEGGVKVVSGRIKLTNAYGSELLALPITATAQYFNTAGNWATSITDSVTQFDTRLSTAGGNVQATIVNGPLALGNISVVAPGMVTLANGVTMFRLAAPTIAGSADLGIVTAPAYLLPSIAGRATFGVYKGPSEIIYMREAY